MGSGSELFTTITGVGTTWKTVAITGPEKYQILRARAQILSGSGTTVALRVKQKDEDKEIKLEYTASASIDSVEKQDYIIIHAKEKANSRGTTYISVMVNTGTDSSVYVSLDIEEVL